MNNIDLKKYGILDTTEILYNPTYEVLYNEETKPGLEGYDKGQVTELGAINVMTGIYTGGTMNFFALGSALKVDPNVIMFIYTFEMVVTFPLILFITGGGYRLFRKILPYKDSSFFQSKDGNANGMEENGVEDYRRMLHRKVFPKTMCGLGLSLLFLAVGAGLSLLITGKLNELVIIMTITTLSIAASFSE